MSEHPKRKQIIIAAAVLAAVIVFGVLAAFVFDDADAWRDKIAGHLEMARGTPWAFPLVCALYVFGGAVMFPVTVLNLACALVFGLPGIFYALAGAMANAGVYFGIGRLIQKRYGERLLANPKIKTVDEKLKDTGVMGSVAVHLLPVPPYTIVNLAAGVTSIGFAAYMLGTLLVMIPGAVARGVVGDSLTKVIMDPTPETYMYVGFGLVLWAAFIAATHFAVKKFQPQH